jgi:urease accessory protein
MRASARIVAEADGRGGTRLAVLRGEPPLLLRRTGPRAGALSGGAWSRCGGVTVHLVSGAAGPLRGDDLRLDVEVGPGARLEVRSAAASLALPGPATRLPSRLDVSAVVAAQATLRWLPEPLIAAIGCHHHAVTDVRVAAGGAVVWRDDLVCGRHGEPAGDVRSDVTFRYADGTLYRHELVVGPRAPGWSGAAVLGSSGSGHGGGRAVGSVVLAGPEMPAAAVLGPDAVLMPLAGPGMLAIAVGADIREVRAALDPICAAALDEAPMPETVRPA